MEDKSLIWKKRTWLSVFSLYTKLLEYLTHDVNFMCTFISAIEPGEVDYVARCIVNIFTKTGFTLELINAMIYNEFSRAASEGEGSVMRGNSIINKIEGIYVREIGSHYLKHVVGDLVTKIATDTKLSLEIDPRKVSLVDEPENILNRSHSSSSSSSSSSSPSISSSSSSISSSSSTSNDNNGQATIESIVAQNQKRLVECAQAFVDRITDPQMIDDMPKEIRQIAAKTAQCARKFTPDSLNPLIGGFIMLRFFSPAIATPESSKLIPPEVIPSPRAKRNLVLVAKVLQNASNGLLFGAKEEFMTCMNDFITSNKSKMSDYFTAICKDAQIVSNKSRIERYLATTGKTSPPPSQPSSNGSTSPSNSSLNVKQTVIGSKKNSSALNLSTTSSPPPPATSHSAIFVSHSSPSISPTNNNNNNNNNNNHSIYDIDLRDYDLQDIFDLHRVLDSAMEKVKAKHATAKNGDDPCMTFIDNFQRITLLLKDLGPSPKTKHQSRKKEEEKEPTQRYNQPITNPQMMFEDVMGVLERARFLYQGPDDKQGCPVFYLIVNRIKPEFLDNINPLVSHIFKVMDEVVNNGYSLVIDMSWASVNNELKRVVYAHLPNLAKIFSRRYKKNVLGIYIVHPSAYTRAVVHFMRFFTSRKLKRKIVEIYNWKQLTKLIDTEKILLPETSKDYITKSYKLIKVNAKGKKQERLIKFTANSLLNIDPKTKRLQNEKRIDEIEEMTSVVGSSDLTMRFNTNDKQGSTKKGPFSMNFSSSNDRDLALRRYLCSNVQERDSILQDIYEMAFKSHWMKPPPEFKVTKVNQAGKHQDRVFKFTIDSLLNLNNTQIKSETSYAGIENVVLDPVEPDTAWLKLKAENFKRKIICKEAKLLVEHLTEAVNRYTIVAENEEGHFRQEGDDEYNTG